MRLHRGVDASSLQLSQIGEVGCEAPQRLDTVTSWVRRMELEALFDRKTQPQEMWCRILKSQQS